MSIATAPPQSRTPQSTRLSQENNPRRMNTEILGGVEGTLWPEQVTTKLVRALGNLRTGQQLRKATESVPGPTCRYQAWLRLLPRVMASYTFFSKSPPVSEELQRLKWGLRTLPLPTRDQGDIFTWFWAGIPRRRQV